jgi:hypothetical protein
MVLDVIPHSHCALLEDAVRVMHAIDIESFSVMG